MVDLRNLEVPIVAAPMAGGPTTVDLVMAAARAGGLGFLAAGYQTPAALRAEIDRVSGAGMVFGVNIFAPGRPVRDRDGLTAYREALRPLMSRYGIEPAASRDARDPVDDDGFDAKVDMVIHTRVPVVSFTFGLPPAAVCARLRAAGIVVVASIADVADVDRAERCGVDALCVQGAEAGGHRATLDVDATPNSTPTLTLLREVAATTALPLIAAGGIGDGRGIAECLEAGASAVQLGTALLDTTEAGTNPVHRAALANPELTDTVVTRAFSGRPARAVRNRFTDEYGPLAPSEYPAVHHLTSPLRKAAVAAGDADTVNLWAGTGPRIIGGGSAVEVITRLWSEAAVR